MKDKLEKTGHRKRYYQFRYFVVAFLFVLTAIGTILRLTVKRHRPS